VLCASGAGHVQAGQRIEVQLLAERGAWPNAPTPKDTLDPEPLMGNLLSPKKKQEAEKKKEEAEKDTIVTGGVFIS